MAVSAPASRAGWRAAGHEVLVAGRSIDKARAFCAGAPASCRSPATGATSRPPSPSIGRTCSSTRPAPSRRWTTPSRAPASRRACPISTSPTAANSSAACPRSMRRRRRPGRRRPVGCIERAGPVRSRGPPSGRRHGARFARSRWRSAPPIGRPRDRPSPISILSQVGQPVRIRRGGRWMRAFGWQDMRRERFACPGDRTDRQSPRRLGRRARPGAPARAAARRARRDLPRRHRARLSEPGAVVGELGGSLAMDPQPVALCALASAAAIADAGVGQRSIGHDRAPVRPRERAPPGAMLDTDRRPGRRPGNPDARRRTARCADPVRHRAARRPGRRACVDHRGFRQGLRRPGDPYRCRGKCPTSAAVRARHGRQLRHAAAAGPGDAPRAPRWRSLGRSRGHRRGRLGRSDRRGGRRLSQSRATPPARPLSRRRRPGNLDARFRGKALPEPFEPTRPLARRALRPAPLRLRPARHRGRPDDGHAALVAGSRYPFPCGLRRGPARANGPRTIASISMYRSRCRCSA